MKHKLSKITLAMLSATSLSFAASVNAQDAPEPVAETEVIEVTGIRSALTSALAEKRETVNLVEVIEAVDIGKLPDQNLAEVLENVTGIQITRTAGVGTGVQIRGSNDNRVEINGVSTVGSGSGRTGMNFEDLSAGIIAGIEVAKIPDAKTIEGSVGGTINLRTIRPLELDSTLLSLRAQGEDSSLSAEGGITPRFSGTYGDNWDLSSGGQLGFVISASYTEQEATSFRPRVDRDGALVESVNADVVRSGELEDLADRPAAQDFDFIGIQFLNQELENFEFDTTNIATTLEYAPNDNTKFFFDAVITEQERRQDSTRVQGSGVSTLRNVTVPDTFEIVDFGSLDGVDLGSIAAAETGRLDVNLDVDDDDPNLRFNSDTGARITDSEVFRFGGEWQGDNWKASFELSSASSETNSPNLSTQLNFINPNSPLDNLDADGNPTADTSNDNSTPFIFDLTGGDLTFGVDFDSDFAPTVADLLNPDNVVLDQVDFGADRTENEDNAFRVDFTYFLDNSIVTSIDFGYRYNKSEHDFTESNDRIGGFSRLVDSPSGALFEELLVAGPDNFGDADGRELAIRNFIIIDPDRAFDDPEGVIEILEEAIIAHGGNQDFIDDSADELASFNSEEETHALYAQANFEAGIFRGNLGVRYIDSDVESVGNTEVNGVVSPESSSGSFDFVLPRFNLVADISDDFVIRLGYAEDIRRADYDLLNTSVSFSTNENSSLELGNPELEPEEVKSFDISAEWYFAEAAVFSVGYFRKERSNLFVSTTETTPQDAQGFVSTDPSCPGGGIFNPIAEANVLQAPGVTGLCVDFESNFNDDSEVTQTGIEIALQYDLSAFEDELGWASGFGILANYTIQDFDGGSAVDTSATRGTDIFNAINGITDDANFEVVEAEQGLLDFSETAYNATFYYEKHGLSARLRYTWREAFRTDDTAAGASRNSTLGFPVVTHDRGQLNASISYDINDQWNIGVEAVNLTESDITQSCVNEDALLCFQGITDRRITFGVNYRL